jgi:carbon-monoxide dehydrogenase medium subunit
MKAAPFDFVRPETVDGAISAMGAGATALAGGQSLLPMLALRVANAENLVGVTRLPDLRNVRDEGAHVRIGAAITHAEIEDGTIIDPSRGMMAEVAHGIAYRAVRNFGTIGGAVALADPAADWPVCLAALDATVVLVGRAGERRVALSAFVQGPYATDLQPDELILAFEIPRLHPAARWGYVKIARKQGAYADALAAAVLPAPGMRPRLAAGATREGIVLLEKTSQRLADEPSIAVDALRDEIRADLAPVEADADPHRLRCHMAAITRAIARMRGMTCV